MPVTFYPAKHATRSIPSFPSAANPASLLMNVNEAAHGRMKELLQFGVPTPLHELQPMPNGLVSIIVDAYNNHQALIIRPDDVWLTILVQFNFYVNAHAEELRHLFVAHEGKKTLEVGACGDRYTVNYATIAQQMTELIHQNVVDPELQSWILPSFTTTTQNDLAVASMVMMATLQAYFEYHISITCGLPKVTLEGERRDWENILLRARKLTEFGQEPTMWFKLLEPVLTRFVRAFDDPHGEANIDFWQRVVHYEFGGSGPDWVGGWVSAFCVWNHEGKWIGEKLGPWSDDLVQQGPSKLKVDPIKQPGTFNRPIETSTTDLNDRLERPNSREASIPGKISKTWSKIKVGSSNKIKATQAALSTFVLHSSIQVVPSDTTAISFNESELILTIDGIRYHRLRNDKLPAATASVDVTVNDNGCRFDCMMTAGIVGAQVLDSGEQSKMSTGLKDTYKPVSGWWMYVKK